jgi:hypothetical protein
MFIFIYKFVLWLQRSTYISAYIVLQKELYPGELLIIKIKFIYVLVEEAKVPCSTCNCKLLQHVSLHFYNYTCIYLRCLQLNTIY